MAQLNITKRDLLLKYFINNEVTSQNKDVHFSQLKYAYDLLMKHDMLLSKPVSTPISAKAILTSNDDALVPIQRFFRKLLDPYNSCRSSVESEYCSLSHASAESTWLAYLLYELGACIQFPILLHCDNLSATYMASNPIFHARTKHIGLDYHFVREKVALEAIVFALSLQ
ncbi:uncharacterized protein [Populus alba]|uniref:uncharacterized protein n=1 Tax=Populus alba TaxID=43335 RepID=UPI00158866C7|nr:uncharacterized protein LOC118027481 [Populus alba]